jgi:hypothetical protein
MKPTNSKQKTSHQPSFLEVQHEFTQYIRHPNSAPAPNDIEKRRADIYRDLFYNNIEGFLADNFPVLKQITDDKHWHKMAHDFFARHPSVSPYFSDIADEFINYLQSERNQAADSKDDFPFLIELAHYEWTELVISIIDYTPSDTEISDIQQQTLSVAPTAWPLVYKYPVHSISPEFIPTEVPNDPTYIVVYRNNEDDVVFLKTNPITHLLLERLASNSTFTYLHVLTKLAEEMEHPNPEVVIQGGLSIVEDFINRGIIIAP